MELADDTREPAHADFETDAMRWLPHVARYARLLTRNKPDADDLVQETFLRAYESWHTYRPGSDCRRWLFAICRHRFLRERQRSQRMIAADDPASELRATTDLYQRAVLRGLDGLFDRIDLGPTLERALSELPPEYREVVMLIDIEDQSYVDAASALGVPVGTIRSRLFRARRLLQQALIDHAHDMGVGGSAIAAAPGRESMVK